jgi:hypothetical protein
MLLIVFKIFLISFLINLAWEISHSILYNTCLKLSLKKYVRLIIWASIKDGLWISLFYIISVYIFNNINILTNSIQLLFFVIISLIFAFITEKIAIKYKRWEYSDKMPKIFGAGITPLPQIALTGILTFFLIF